MTTKAFILHMFNTYYQLFTQLLSPCGFLDTYLIPHSYVLFFLQIGPNGYYFAIDPNGYVLLHPNLQPKVWHLAQHIYLSLDAKYYILNIPNDYKITASAQ